MANIVTTLDGTPITTGPAPDKITIYDSTGNPLEVFPVDAREIVQGGGYSYEKANSKDNDPKRKTDADAGKDADGSQAKADKAQKPKGAIGEAPDKTKK